MKKPSLKSQVHDWIRSLGRPFRLKEVDAKYVELGGTSDWLTVARLVQHLLGTRRVEPGPHGGLWSAGSVWVHDPAEEARILRELAPARRPSIFDKI